MYIYTPLVGVVFHVPTYYTVFFVFLFRLPFFYLQSCRYVFFTLIFYYNQLNTFYVFVAFCLS